MAIIRLEGLSVFGHHGARPYEKEAGQRLEVDLELVPTDDRAESSDRLGDAVDYDAIYRTVREVVEGKSFHLLEALAAANPTAVSSHARSVMCAQSPTSASDVRAPNPDDSRAGGTCETRNDRAPRGTPASAAIRSNSSGE